MWPLVRFLAPLIALVMLLPGFAAAQEEPIRTAPTVTSPPPEDPIPPVETAVTVAVPPEPHTITVVVLAPPERARVPKPAAERKQVAPPVRQSRSRAAPAPTASREYAEPQNESSTPVVPTATATAAKADQSAKAARAAKSAKAAKAARKRRQAKAASLTRPAPPVVTRQPVIRVPDRMPASGVLAAQFSSASVDPPAAASNIVLYLALAFACLLSISVALGAAAPILAWEWPRVFGRVVQLQEQLPLVAAWVVCAAITLVLTWALTGSGT